EVAARVHHPDVAGVEPALGVDRLRRLLRIVEVAAHHVVPADEHLARLAAGQLPSFRIGDADLDAGDGAAGGAGDGLRVVVEVAHGGDAGGLGEAVARDDGL